ncbi:TorF family putative porin [Altererythrobacter lauratis]|uniref:TorF family putative porin n=1 Tax=Alteraurantiacibacter lauratis TaxID=2054627 RepID=A0ABV7EES5_9SPHN
MLTSVRSLMAATVLAGSAFVAAPAAAQDIGVEISANAAIVSEYRFRGVDLSGGDIAVQGGIDLALPAGFYVGTWGSSLDETTVGYGHTELDIYGGWSSEVAPGVTFDVGGIFYLYPNAGAGDFDYYELYSSVGFEAGPAGLTLGVAYAPKQDSLGNTDNFYIYSDVSVGLPGTPISIDGHLGYTDGFLTYTANSKAWDYSIGASVGLGETLSLGVAYVGAEGNSAPYNFVDDAVVVSLSASF